jgi:hypothetical protein
MNEKKRLFSNELFSSSPCFDRLFITNGIGKVEYF